MTDLLGGATRGKTRPRGFVDWRPQATTLALLDQVRDVLDEYADYLPLTVRQVFYRLVGAYGYDKTERAYERLSEALNRARPAISPPNGGRLLTTNMHLLPPGCLRSVLQELRRQAARRLRRTKWFALTTLLFVIRVNGKSR